jgi:hypothetical protein
MNQSLKSVLQLAAIVFGIFSLMVWLNQDAGDPWIWFCRIVLPILTLLIIRSLWRSANKPDLAPDYLHKQFGTSFERNGMCFYPQLAVEPERSLCWFEIYFQNRYDGACKCMVKFEPSCKSYSFARHEVPTIEVPIDCPGGAGGVVRIPYPIPAKYQGRRIQFEVTAWTKYTGKAGKILRHREGMRVGALRSDLDPVGCLIGILFVMLLIIYLPTRVYFELPEQVTDTTPPEANIETLILWDYDPVPKNYTVRIPTQRT